MRDFRGRTVVGAERSTAYVTVNASNSSNSRTGIVGQDGALQRSPAIRRAFQQTTNKSTTAQKLTSIKIKLFPGSIKRHEEKPAMRGGRDCRATLKTPNGSICSDTSHSPSGSPRLNHAQHIGEELEMSDGVLGEKQTILPKSDVITVDGISNVDADTML